VVENSREPEEEESVGDAVERERREKSVMLK
jgi:hypothetical protein